METTETKTTAIKPRAIPSRPAPLRSTIPTAPVVAIPRGTVKFTDIDTNTGHRVVIYGPGGIGKTTLAAQAPGPVAFIDLDDSLSRLKPEGNYKKVGGVKTWNDLRGVLQSDGWDGIKSIVIDTGTKAEELAAAHTIETVKHEKGHAVTSIEGYGFGKGYQFVFDTFLNLLPEMDRHCREGRNVIIICHDCTSTVPNPSGEDWLRYEPRLQSPNSGKASIRLRVREWADHVLFLGYDVDVKDGKGKGCGSRTIYPAELPHCMAKSRTCHDPMPVEQFTPQDLWAEILK